MRIVVTHRQNVGETECCIVFRYIFLRSVKLKFVRSELEALVTLYEGFFFSFFWDPDFALVCVQAFPFFENGRGGRGGGGKGHLRDKKKLLGVGKYSRISLYRMSTRKIFVRWTFSNTVRTTSTNSRLHFYFCLFVCLCIKTCACVIY